MKRFNERCHFIFRKYNFFKRILFVKGGPILIIGVHNIQITIPKGKEDEGRKFYCGVLCLNEIEKPKQLKGRGGFWLQAGDHAVHIGTEDGFDRFKTKAHIAYQVEDLDFWSKRLQKYAIEIIEAVPISGFERFEFRDPFGNRVEMIQELNN